MSLLHYTLFFILSFGAAYPAGPRPGPGPGQINIDLRHPNQDHIDRFLYVFEHGWRAAAVFRKPFINGRIDYGYPNDPNLITAELPDYASKYIDDYNTDAGGLYYHSQGRDQHRPSGAEYDFEVRSRALKDLFLSLPKDPVILSAIGNLSKDPPTARSRSIRRDKQMLQQLIDGVVGLPPGTLYAHPELNQFVKANHITQLAQLYGTKFDMDLDDQPLLPYNGELHVWTDVLAAVKLNRDSTMQDHVFTLNGIEIGNLDSDIRLIQKSGKPIYDTRYVMEVLSYPMPSDTAQSWIRLYNPNGEIYSVGWEPYSARWWERLNPFGTSARPGKVISPALEEQLIPKERLQRATITAFEMTPEAMTEILQFLKEYQKSPGPLTDTWQFVKLMLSKTNVHARIVRNYGTEGSFPFSRLRDWRQNRIIEAQNQGLDAEAIDQKRFELPVK